MDTTTQYVPRDYRRVCDQCGNLYNRSQLHRRRNWIFCSDCEPPGSRIIEEENAEIARMRPFRILPVPNPKPLLTDGYYNFITEEAVVYDFIMATAPARNIGGANSVDAAAWATCYLADIVNQNTRPATWVSSAKTKIASLVTYLLTQQYGSPTGVASTAPDPRYGGFNSSNFYTTATTIAAGLAFIKAYSALGTPEYLNAANRCATFIRHAQCGNIQATKHTVYPSGGSAYYVGGLATSVADSTQLQSGSYNVSDVYAIVFLKALGVAVGLSTQYGDAASTAYFTSATQATLTTMIADLVTFAEIGPKDSAHADATTPGLSTTAPKTTYGAYLSDATGSGSWGAPSTTPGISVAMATAGVYAASATDAAAAAIVPWLLAFTANSANATPTSNTPEQTIKGITGTYDPTVAPATSLLASAPFKEASGAFYDLAALGVLAPTLSGLSVATLRNGRTTLAPSEPYTTIAPNSLTNRSPGVLGRAGLSFQPVSSSGGAFTPDVVLAAQWGGVYRWSNP
jgi:hypothetical protein